MNKIRSHYLFINIFSYIPEIKELELIKYNNKLKQLLKVNKYQYQKLFVENNFIVDLSKYKILNLIKFLKTNYNNFDGKDDENNLKKIISEIPWFGDYKKEKIITKNENNYKNCLNKETLDNLELNDQKILSKLRILNIQIDKAGGIFVKDIFPHLVKLKIKTGGKVIKISYNLLKRIQVLSLINSKINIEPRHKKIELLSLKSLKIIEDKEFKYKEKFLCPNLEYLVYSFINESKKIFNFPIEEFLEKIPLIFSKLMYCKIIYRNRHRPPYMGERQYDYKNEIIVRKCGKDYFKYDTYNNSYVHGFRCLNDLCVKKFYYSKRERLKKDIPENYEEIYEIGNGGRLFDIITKKENLKYLQFIGIFVDIYSKGIFVHPRNGLNIIKVLIENLKYFFFERILFSG